MDRTRSHRFNLPQLVIPGAVLNWVIIVSLLLPLAVVPTV